MAGELEGWFCARAKTRYAINMKAVQWLVIGACVVVLPACDVSLPTGSGQGTNGAIETANAAPGSCHYGPHMTPDVGCTPGAADSRVTQDNLSSTICASGWSKKVRPSASATDPIKRERMTAYGVSDQPAADYELDHLIPIEMGGATEVKNLWPQPALPVPGFHEKDKLEGQYDGHSVAGLHGLVCSGQMDLATAQRAFSENWYAAYEQYCVARKDVCRG